jgi:hypothetical protein
MMSLENEGELPDSRKGQPRPGVVAREADVRQEKRKIAHEKARRIRYGGLLMKGVGAVPLII